MSDTGDTPLLTKGNEELLHLREMFAQSPSFSALLDGPEYRFVLTNAAYQRLVEHRPVIGLTVREAFPEVERQGFLALLDEVFATGKPFVGRDVEIVLQSPHDDTVKTHFLDFVYQPVKHKSGRVTGIFVEGSDQTERHVTEVALRASEASLRELNRELERRVIERAQARGLTWQLSPDLLGALNSQGYFETSNPAWQTVLGWSEEEVASMSIFELLHPDDVEHTRAGFELVLVGQPALRFANRYRCKDGGHRWISWVGILEDGFIYCTGRDITVEKLAEIELAEAQEALRQSQKMEAIGQLTGGIAHDFNNLLTGPRFMDAATSIRAAGSGADAPAACFRPAPIAGHSAQQRQPVDREHRGPATPHFGRADRATDRPCRRSLAGFHRHQPARERVAESRHQFAGRHARRRHVDDFDRELPAHQSANCPPGRRRAR